MGRRGHSRATSVLTRTILRFSPSSKGCPRQSRLSRTAPKCLRLVVLFGRQEPYSLLVCAYDAAVILKRTDLIADGPGNQNPVASDDEVNLGTKPISIV